MISNQEERAINEYPARRVRLIPLTEEWIDRLIAWRSQPEAALYQPITALSKEHLHRFVKARKSAQLKELAENDYILIIVDEDRGEGVGWMTLEIMSHLHGLARIGYTISKENWGLGYATAAVRTLVYTLFTKTPVERIEADCALGNPASQRVLEKCGFRLVGTKRKYLLIQGQRVDHHNFELCKDDFSGD